MVPSYAFVLSLAWTYEITANDRRRHNLDHSWTDHLSGHLQDLAWKKAVTTGWCKSGHSSGLFQAASAR